MCASLAACQRTSFNSATSAQICTEWASTMFLPSRADTPDTVQGLNDAGPVYGAACGNIPGAPPPPF